ncbi:lysophospholipase [Bacillus sp. FJAT-27264]|uniref:GDSL-type esterase/lipase family protein n=1 Tax=Paenibacillus sp. (strain DSM 101736 / FJAT-27264) TaxID=1850362 RepID=UPI000807F246|nr:GDSL-type esterase/lipase family protein [Bacillus sp. FJAT-27264]OBZ19560.1 lysophospholipase [Bacillus sp. FJAT-27264]
MNDSKWTWRSVSLISIATTLVLITGFGYAVSDILSPKGDVPLTSLPQATPAPQNGAVKSFKVVALGDSLAKGTGDNTGNGYVKNTVAGLSASGVSAELLGNMGINGLTTAGLQNKLKDAGVQYSLRQANVILLSIGGNDLFRGADLLQNGAGNTQAGSSAGTKPSNAAGNQAGKGTTTGTSGGKETNDLTPEALLAALPEAAERLGKILNTITEINPAAQIYYVGLYNPFGDIKEMLIPGNQAVTAWNNAAMDIINKNSRITLVPTFDLFNNHLDKYLSSDHFHPNSDGYKRMGERIVQAIQ